MRALLIVLLLAGCHQAKDLDVTVGSTHMSGKNIRFRVDPHSPGGGPADLTLYVDGIRGAGNEEQQKAVNQLLEAAIGKQAVDNKLGQVTILPSTSAPADVKPFAELPSTVNGWK